MNRNLRRGRFIQRFFAKEKLTGNVNVLTGMLFVYSLSLHSFPRLFSFNIYYYKANDYQPVLKVAILSKIFLPIQFKNIKQYFPEGDGCPPPSQFSRVCEEGRVAITETEATNCFSINLQEFTNNNQRNFIKIHFNFFTV